MADPRFFENLGPFTLAQICEKAGIALPAGTDGAKLIADLADLAGAGPQHLAFFSGASNLREAFAGSGAGAIVTFEPGARTAWHIHPLGQTLIVMAGSGLAQRWGGPVEEIRPGDVVWFPPGEKHWHGATATTAMSHIAIQEKLNGSPVDWLEHVTDAQYAR